MCIRDRDGATFFESYAINLRCVNESPHGALNHDLHAAVLTPACGRVVTRHRFGRGVTVGLDSVRRNGVLDEDGFHGLGPELGELRIEFDRPGRVGVTFHEDLPIGGARQRLTDPGEALAGAGLDVRAAGFEAVSYTHLRAHETRHDL